MKIGILTQLLHVNYGGLLQNYALQKVLKDNGHEVETLDWGYKTLRARLGRVKRFVLKSLFPKQMSKRAYAPTNAETSKIRQNTNRFIDKYISRAAISYSAADFKSRYRKGGYDALVAGSDQCWRPMYNGRFITSMFFDFAEGMKVKRLSYAASFGTDSWEYDQELSERCAKLVQQFDFVSVREDSGVRLCKEHFGVDATHVLDPTMLLTREDYIQLIENEQEPQSAGTLFNYILDPDPQKSELIKRTCDKTGLKSFQVLPKYTEAAYTKELVKTQINDCVYPAVTAWLRAFYDAEMTIVDSFHGVVFSIIFNKPFWVIGNVKRGMSRFTSLLKLFHLEDRIISIEDIDNLDISKPIDWPQVNNILQSERARCKSLLLQNLSN